MNGNKRAPEAGLADHGLEARTVGITFEEGFQTLRQTDITDRQRGFSGMPEGFGQGLSRLDVREIVEYQRP